MSYWYDNTLHNNLLFLEKTKNPKNSFPDPVIEPESACPAVAIATT